MEYTITPSKLKENLLNDLNYVINMIIDNNGSEVKSRLISLDYGGWSGDITTNEDIILVVNQMIEDDLINDLRYALSVPLLTEKIPKIYYLAIEQATDEAFSRLKEKGIYALNDPNPMDLIPSAAEGDVQYTETIPEKDFVDTTTNMNWQNIWGVLLENGLDLLGVSTTEVGDTNLVVSKEETVVGCPEGYSKVNGSCVKDEDTTKKYLTWGIIAFIILVVAFYAHKKWSN